MKTLNDKHASACHPERGEGSLPFGTEETLRCAQGDGYGRQFHFQSSAGKTNNLETAAILGCTRINANREAKLHVKRKRVSGSGILAPSFAVALIFAAIGCQRQSSDLAAAAPEPYSVKTASGIEMVYLPGGAFTMGASDGPADEAPPHKVAVSPLLMDKFEVTHEMFAKVQLPDPSHWQEPANGPVERVRWRDAKAYCNERSRLETLRPCYDEKSADWDCDASADGYRLPTEAEWEYAARAGTDTPHDFGSADKLGQYAWYADNAEQKTHPVGQKKPNAWGLFDMYGNVSEWCEDVYSTTYYAQSAAADPTGPPNPGKDVKRVMRGGNWKAGPDACRASFRRGERTGNTDACFATDYCGFRCVRRPTAGDLEKMKAGTTK